MTKVNLSRILFSTRIYRVLNGCLALLVPLAFANQIEKNVFLLMLIFISIYISIGIHNAIKDKDFPLPKKTKYFVPLFFIIAILISLTNKTLFLATLFYIVIGIFYNSLSRKILFGDITTLSISHNAFPILISSIIIGLPTDLTIKISLFSFFAFWTIINIKNLKDYKEDKKRKYKTIGTYFQNYEKIAKIFLWTTNIFIFSGIIIFQLKEKFIVFFTLGIIIQLTIHYLINKKRFSDALNFMRLFIMIIFFGIILEKTNNFLIIFTGAGIISIYLLTILIIHNKKYE